ncbi:MAG TPA: hypothetical protein VKT52_02760 [Ktedonobacterales bacterium]|nr:hypothetical protein [Ktedonobacterales bacterium]
MAYQITLTDGEYAALKAAAAQRKSTIEALVHEALTERFETDAQTAEPPPEPKRPMTQQEFLEYLYRKGRISNIPTRRPDTPEEAAERERLANSVKPGISISDMVIEDRGPR